MHYAYFTFAYLTVLCLILINKWMSEWISQWVNGWMDGWKIPWEVAEVMGRVAWAMPMSTITSELSTPDAGSVASFGDGRYVSQWCSNRSQQAYRPAIFTYRTPGAVQQNKLQHVISTQHHHHHLKCLVPGLQWTRSAWQYKSQYNINSKLTAGIKIVTKVSLQITLESSSTCYFSKRFRKRVPNGRSKDAERSLPELSPGSGYNEVSGVGRT